MTNPNDPAYPETYTNGTFFCRNAQENFPDISSNGGFTKREQLAAMAMQGAISSLGPTEQISVKFIAEGAVQYADALIEALNAGAKA